MNKQRIILFLLLSAALWGLPRRAAAQIFAVRANALAACSATLNVGAETALTDNWSLELSGYWNPVQTASLSMNFHAVQLGGHILARIEAGLHLDDATREQLVHFFVRAGEHIAGALDQAFLEDEVRDGVVDHLADDIAQGLTVRRAAQFVQPIDVLHDAPMLFVDFFNASVKFRHPDQNGHANLQK